MVDLTEHAERELRLLQPEIDYFYGEMNSKTIMQLIEVFAEQIHNRRISTGIVRELFYKLSKFEPIMALTFEDDEWRETNTGTFRNIRHSSVFKEGKDGKPYYVKAFVKRKRNECEFCQGTLTVGDGRILKRCYIKDPANMPTITMITDEEGVLVDLRQLNELSEFYELEFENEKESGKQFVKRLGELGDIIREKEVEL